MSILSTLLEERSTLVAKRDALLAKVEGESRTALTEAEDAEFRGYITEERSLDTRIEELADAQKRDNAAAEAGKIVGASPAVVRSEPQVYGRGSGQSYFRDLGLAFAPGGMANSSALDRLQRHRTEMEVEARNRPEYRANMNRTDNTGGEFVPPLWLIDQYVALARAARVTADLCRKMPLPAGTDTISLPSVSTGTAVAAQTADGATVSKTDMTTSSVSASVKTLAGQQVFAMQLLDQSPINFDEVVFADLLADLNAKLDVQVLNGSGASGQVTGILGVSSTVAVTYTDASPTVPELYPKLADAVQQIHSNRYLPPTAWVMHPRRWQWILAGLDSSNRPFAVPSQQGPYNALAHQEGVVAQGPAGQMLGLPVYTDPNMPTTLGGGTEDKIIGARFDDLFLWESAIRSRVLFETDANTLEVRLQLWEYVAFMGNRYPKAIGIVSGTGLAAPTF